MKLLLAIQIASIAIAFSAGRSVEENVDKRLIQTSEHEPPTWMTEKEIFELIERNQGFMDVTDHDYSNVRIQKANVDAIPTTPRFNATVQRLISGLDSSRAEEFLTHFSSYFNRYYTSATGEESAQWLLQQVQESVQGYVGNHEVEAVTHNWRQNSIIVRLIGADATKRDEVIVIGAHLDSTAGGANALSPGADDNGSGSSAILEALRALVEGGVVLNRTVEFQWYAAEEVGLRGSQDIADDYKSRNVNVVGMLNLDIVGYYTPGLDDIAVYTDYASDELAEFIRLLTDSYLAFGSFDRICGYACSDHGSWDRQGYPAIFVAEAIDTPFMHRATDTISTVDFNQINEFVKLTVAYAVEFGEVVSETPRK